MFKEDLNLGNSPNLVFVKGVGVFSKRSFSIAQKEQLKCYYNVIVRQPETMVLCVLASEKIKDLLNWDAEKHRQSLQF